MPGRVTDAQLVEAILAPSKVIRKDYETVAIATQEKIPLITSPFGMFELCGRLHRAGLPSFESHVPTS